MVKDRIFQMDNGKSYYILEEIEYNAKKYILTVECDVEKDTVNESDYFVVELSLENGELAIKHIVDDNTASTVVAMLLEKVRNS